MKEVGRNMQDVKQKFHIFGTIAGMDAHPFVGGGTRLYRGNKATYCEMEAKFEGLLMEWITKHDVKLANTFSKG